MIADALDAEIRSYIARMRTDNPLFAKAAAGMLSGRTVSIYLANIHYLLSHTVPYLSRARALALAAGDAALAAHFAAKLGEEAGHEVWAEEDLGRMGRTLANTSGDVLPAMRDVVAFIAGIIEEDPPLYLAYMLQAEQIVAAIGPEWLKFVEERCGISRDCVSVIGHHAELDGEHTDEALECIDGLVGDPSKLPRMREVVVEALALFQRFCEELTAGDLAVDLGHANVAAA